MTSRPDIRDTGANRRLKAQVYAVLTCELGVCELCEVTLQSTGAQHDTNKRLLSSFQADGANAETDRQTSGVRRGEEG